MISHINSKSNYQFIWNSMAKIETDLAHADLNPSHVAFYETNSLQLINHLQIIRKAKTTSRYCCIIYLCVDHGNNLLSLGLLLFHKRNHKSCYRKTVVHNEDPLHYKLVSDQICIKSLKELSFFSLLSFIIDNCTHCTWWYSIRTFIYLIHFSIMIIVLNLYYIISHSYDDYEPIKDVYRKSFLHYSKRNYIILRKISSCLPVEVYFHSHIVPMKLSFFHIFMLKREQ
jgi:hypothetical protein